MNISFYTVALIFAVAFIMLVMIGRSIYQPITRITKTAKRQYRRFHCPDWCTFQWRNRLSGKHTQLHGNGAWYAWGGSAQVCFQRVTRLPLPSYLDKGLRGEPYWTEPFPVEMQDKYLNIILFETEETISSPKSYWSEPVRSSRHTPGYCWFWHQYNDPHDNSHLQR